METPSQPEFDQENLNEDVQRMRTVWINEMVRLAFVDRSICILNESC